MIFVGDFKDLSIYLDKDGIVLFKDKIKYKSVSKNIITQLKYLQRSKDYEYLVLYKGDNIWVLALVMEPIHTNNPYSSLDFFNFILNSQLIKDILIINDILE